MSLVTKLFIKRFKGSPDAQFIVDSLEHYYTGIGNAPDIKSYVQSYQLPSAPTSPSFEKKTDEVNLSNLI